MIFAMGISVHLPQKAVTGAGVPGRVKAQKAVKGASKILECAPAVKCCITSYHIIPHHISHHNISYHIISYHIMSYHFENLKRTWWRILIAACTHVFAFFAFKLLGISEGSFRQRESSLLQKGSFRYGNRVNMLICIRISIRTDSIIFTWYLVVIIFLKYEYVPY